MSSDNEVLWVVSKRHWMGGNPTALYLFRSREAARKFVKDKKRKPTVSRYAVMRAKWGPEQ